MSTNHNLFEEKVEPKQNWAEALLLTSPTPYRWAKPAHSSCLTQTRPPKVLSESSARQVRCLYFVACSPGPRSLLKKHNTYSFCGNEINNNICQAVISSREKRDPGIWKTKLLHTVATITSLYFFSCGFFLSFDVFHPVIQYGYIWVIPHPSTWSDACMWTRWCVWKKRRFYVL